MSRTAQPLLVSILLLVGAASAASQERPPNVVFFLVDDLGAHDLGCTGSEFYETPRVDQLASEGVRFTQAYAASPVCSPTRASLLTGRHPNRLGITTYISMNRGNQPEKWKRKTALLPAPYEDRVPLAELTLAEALKQAGYATFFAGKWHLGPEGHFPEDQGFDVNRGGLARGGPYGGDKYFSPYGNARLEDGPDGEHLPARLADETVQFIEQHRDEPFFCYLAFYSVHTPLIGRPDLVAKYEEKAGTLDPERESWGVEGARKKRLLQDHAVYAAMVEAMDLAVGDVLDALERLNLADNTIVVFFSDNGGLSTSEGHPTSNEPLRAGKGWLYEGGLREPCIVRAPGVAPGGVLCDAPIVSMDFYPTLLELCGLDARPDQHQDGRSFADWLREPASPANPERELYWHFPHYGNQGGFPGAALRVGDKKLVLDFETDELEYYDLAEDPEELHDLRRLRSVEVQEEITAMRARLDRLAEDTGARLPTPREADDDR